MFKCEDKFCLGIKKNAHHVGRGDRREQGNDRDASYRAHGASCLTARCLAGTVRLFT